MGTFSFLLFLLLTFNFLFIFYFVFHLQREREREREREGERNLEQSYLSQRVQFIWAVFLSNFRYERLLSPSSLHR